MSRSESMHSDRENANVCTGRAARSTARFALVAAVCVLALAPDPCWYQQAQLFSGDPEVSGKFGSSVAISGDTLVAGALRETNGAYSEAGSAYVFTRSGGTWSQQAKLVASDPHANDWFGTSVAVSGDRLVVGASEDDTAAGIDAGSVYMFARSGGVWSPDGHLFAGSAIANEHFGISTAMSGTTMVVGGVNGDAPGESEAGTAYVFTRGATNWTQQDQIFASDAGTGDNFGISVAISGETLVAGANLWDSPTDNAVGAAYAFLRIGTSWFELGQLLADDGTDGDEFGYPVAISGDLIVVGSRLDDTGAGANAGSAYVFARDGLTWSQEAHLFAPDAAADDLFGSAVAISGNTILVGARLDDTIAANGSGSVYVFAREGVSWNLQDHIVARDAGVADEFGRELSLDGETAVVGVPSDNTPTGNDAGSTYVFKLSLLDLFVGESPMLALVPGRR